MQEPILASDEVVSSTVDDESARLQSLVLEAVAIPHRLIRLGGAWQLLVPTAAADSARHQLACFEDENRHWPPPPPLAPVFPWAGHQPPTLLLMGALLVFYGVTGPWREGNPWFVGGASDARLILDHGEWWRLFTSLTLHAGPVHVLSNFLVGAVLVHFLCKTLGSGLGWVVLLAGGGFANYLNILFRAGDHQSVGFSTAVFVAVGALCGLRFTARSRLGLLLPLGGGAGLLALLGAGGERTDLGAHFWGLAVGGGLGLVLGGLPSRWQRGTGALPAQAFLLAGCLALVWCCWRLALG